MPEAVPGRTSLDERQARVLGLSLAGSGVIALVLAIVLGATVSPALYAIALVGVIDLGFAWAYGTGRIGPAARRRREAEQSGEAVAAAEADPGYNPYAREG